MRKWARSPRDDRGATAVEFALLFPVFMILAIGTITCGLAFSRQINVTQAAREASRYGGTYDITAAGGTASWLTAVDNAVTQSAGNASDPTGGYDRRCVAIVVTTSTGAVDSTKSSYRLDGGAATSGSCPGLTAPSIASSAYVQVFLARNIDFFLLFTSPTITLDTLSTTPYEGRLP